MLNELHHLASSLEEVGIRPKYWQADFGKLPKGLCYRIAIAQNGAISSIDPINDELRGQLRKWEPSNGNSFPGFNIQPLYRIAEEERKKQLKKWREGKALIDIVSLKSWCAEETNQNWDNRINAKLEKCLKQVPGELIRQFDNIPYEFGAIEKLISRILKDEFIERFHNSLETYLWDRIEKGSQVTELLPFLVYEGNDKAKIENDRGKLSVFFDVPDYTEYPVMHEKSINWINDQLVTFEENGLNRDPGMDAFSAPCDGYTRKFPTVELPFLADVTLRAMNSESPCQKRYGTIDAISFPFGQRSRRRTKGALEWLKDESREGETWGRAGKKEIVFAYPTVLPNVPVKLAALLGARKNDDVEARFENYARDVVNCLQGLAPSLKDVDLRVFSLRKMDKARTKVVFHRNYSAQRLSDAAREWQQGCSNIPDIRMKSWGNEKGKILMARPETPFPLQISDCLNHVWKLDGTSKDEVKSIPKSSGIELLLEDFAPLTQVPHLLAVALQNGKGLFLSLGNILHRNEALKLEGFNKHKQLMPTILGLLLWKLGIRKESYMNNSSYLVGRMLKLSDELHDLYCKEVRKGRKPPQLLGNALMAAALDSPTQALAQLALRIAPYLGWARTNSTGSAGLSRHFLKELGLVEGKLRNEPLPTRLDDAARAQLLLGYISNNSQTEDTINSQKGECYGQ